MRIIEYTRWRGWLLTVPLALCFYKIASFSLIPGLTQIKAEQPRPSDEFVDRLSVNTVLDGRTYFTRYKDFNAVKRGLAYLGVRRIRDLGLRTQDQETLRRYRELAALGLRGTVVIQPYYPVFGQALVNRAEDVVDIVQNSGQFIEAIEGPNEPQKDWLPFIYKGKTYPENVRLFQAELYAAAKSNPATRHIPVLAPSIFSPAKFGPVPCDIGNIHIYFANRIPTHSPSWMVKNSKQICDKPQIDVTETGYNFSPNNNFVIPGITPTAGYKYLLRTLFEQYNQPAIRYISIYDLLGGQRPNTVNPGYPDFALLWSDGSPKPIATAIRNIIRLLQDPANQSFTPKPLRYSLEGVNQGSKEVSHTLLQKKSGSYFLVLWQTAKIFDDKTRRDIVVPAKAAQLKTKDGLYRFKLYDPFKSASAIATSPTDQTQWQVMIPDYPIIVELEPRL